MEMSIRFPGLNLILSYVPRSFQIFGMEFTIYGILIAVGALLGMGIVTLEAKRNNEDQNKYLDMMIVSLLVSVVGSRLFYVIFSWELYRENLRAVLDLRNGGYGFYGGLLAGFLAAAIFCRIAKLNFWKIADTASLGILLGQMIGRWGNFFNRESFGEYTNLPWAMQLPISAVRSGEVSGTMRDNLMTIDGVSYIQVQPVFLYESLWCLFLFLLLLALRRKKRYEGELFMIYLAGYGLGRFFFEWCRTDKLYIPGTKIGISLVISAVLFVICAPMVVVRGVMAQKRAAIRRRRRALIDARQETAHSDIYEKGKDAQNAVKTEVNGESDTELQYEENVQTENTVGAEAEHNQMPGDFEETVKSKKSGQKAKEEPDEMLNWEDSEYAHISEQWRHHVGKSPTNSEEDQ